MAYIGPAPKLGQNREVDDISSGFNGSTTDFTLQVGGSNVSPGSATSIIVSVNNVIQNPNTDYTINGSTITFTSAPTNGHAFFAVVLNQGVDTSVPANGSVTTAKLGDDAVTQAKIAAGAVGNTELASGAVSAAKIDTGAVTAAKIASSSVGSSQLADDAVTSAKIADGAVVNARLGDDSVTSAKIDAGAVDATALASNAVTTAKINAGAVTNAKLGDDSITAAKIDDGAVGTAALATDAVTQAKIADNAIDSARLASDAVTTAKLADGNISTAKLANSSVTAAKIANSAVTGAKLDNDAVSTAKIGDGQVTAAKLASGVGGKVLQVVSVVKTDTASNSTGSQSTWEYNNSSLRVQITGTSTNNKFLFLGQVTTGGEISTHIGLRDGETSSNVTGMMATGTGNTRASTSGHDHGDSHSASTVPIIGLISVPDTNQHTYYFQFSHTSGGTVTLFINRGSNSGDNAERGRYISSLTVMEIAA